MEKKPVSLTPSARRTLRDLSLWARAELTGNILPYWFARSRDGAGEGFLGEISADDTPRPEKERSVVMVARHLWTFAAAARAAYVAQAGDGAGAAVREPQAGDGADDAVLGPKAGDGAGAAVREPQVGDGADASERAARSAPDEDDPLASAAATAAGLADEAYGYLLRRFHDEKNGGFHWSVDRSGRPVLAKKQIYGQAFAIYALSEYSLFCAVRGDAAHAEPARALALRDAARALAIETFGLLEAHVRDREFGGYFEARAEDWGPTSDSALSSVDISCDKSMNTNLHVLEAYANLYRAAPSAVLREAILSLLEVHARRIAQADGHLGLFFRADWTRMEGKVSYGHDIEASWLMEEAIEVLEGADATTGAAASLAAVAAAAVPADAPAADQASGGAAAEAATFSAVGRTIEALARTALEEGRDAVSGGLDDEAESAAPGAPRNGHRIWWCQAEALVGFVAAWERSGDERYLAAAEGVRGFIDEFIRSPGGDWIWGTDFSGKPLGGYPKGGNWKTGYHNGRACMESMRRAARYAK